MLTELRALVSVLTYCTFCSDIITRLHSTYQYLLILFLFSKQNVGRSNNPKSYDGERLSTQSNMQSLFWANYNYTNVRTIKKYRNPKKLMLLAMTTHHNTAGTSYSFMRCEKLYRSGGISIVFLIGCTLNRIKICQVCGIRYFPKGTLLLVLSQAVNFKYQSWEMSEWFAWGVTR